MSKLEVDAIEPQSGTTLTIGASGDAVNIASGATITDFTSTGIDDNATANALTIDSSSNLQFNSGFGSVATAYGCRAWVNFDGTGTPSISDSGNVSSITDVNTGQYTVNFTTAMPDANYSCVGGQNNEIVRVGSLTTTTVFVRSENENGTNEDTNYFGVAVFR